jgi:hypothetical protein
MSSPAEATVNIWARVPGYRTESLQPKAYYKRNVMMDVEIQLERRRGGL